MSPQKQHLLLLLHGRTAPNSADSAVILSALHNRPCKKPGSGLERGDCSPSKDGHAACCVPDKTRIPQDQLPDPIAGFRWEAFQPMQPRLPIQFATLSGFLILVLSTLSLTFAVATADEGVVVSWLDGTTNSVEEAKPASSISFRAAAATTQLRIVELGQADTPATVINLQLDRFQPIRLEVVDLEGRLVKTLADGLWAQGVHQMAWHHENQDDERLETGRYIVRLVPTDATAEGLALAH